jgi:CubicO group peptidase (beta-lactamase class C family)
MSNRRVASRRNRLYDTMAGFVTRGEILSLVMLISQRDSVDAQAIGTLAIDSKTPVLRDTIFRIASMTKPITATATMILVDECKLCLDDPVDRYLPELSNRKVLKRIDSPLDDTVPANRPITARDLLTFTWGFGLLPAPPDCTPILRTANELQIGMGPPQPSHLPPPDEWIRRLGSLPLMSQPGDRWRYNTASDVLGVLVARASGKLFESFLRERIFEPLGMKDTGFFLPSAKRNCLPTEYRNNFQTGALEVYDDPATGQWTHPPPFPSGSGGLVSTVDDYLAFSRMMLNKGIFGKQRILSIPAVQTMTTDQLTSAQKSDSGLIANYFDTRGGFGMSVVTYPACLSEPVGMYGWDGGLGTSWRADPANDLNGILLTQSAWSSASPPKVCIDFWSSVYESINA